MNTNYIHNRYVNETVVNEEFHRYWIAYKWCATVDKQFNCGCGAIHKPKWNPNDNIDKTNIASLSSALYKHIKTPKHQNSIARQIGFVEHLAEKLKKDIFHDQHEAWEQQQYAEFQEYEKEHQEFLLRRRQEAGFKLWLKKQEERNAKEEAKRLASGGEHTEDEEQ